VILVAGGTGTLGRRLIALLAARGEAVRILTRDPARAAGLPGDVAVGDLRDRQSLARAVQGCSAVVAGAHGFVGVGRTSPEAIDRDGNRNLVRAAADSGVEHLVLLSTLGAAPDHPMSLHRMKYAAEQALRDSGLAWTIVRPSAYLETWVGVIGAKLATGGPALVFGPGLNPINFVAVGDVAALVDRALRDPQLRGQVVEVCGAQNLTLTELAGRLVAERGGTARIKHVPLPMLRAMSVLARPVAPGFARQARMALYLDTAPLSDASRP